MTPQAGWRTSELSLPQVAARWRQDIEFKANAFQIDVVMGLLKSGQCRVSFTWRFVMILVPRSSLAY